MKFLKWFFIAFVAFLVSLGGLLLAAPYLFGDKIRALVDAQVETYLDADLDYGSVDLSVLRSFPNLAVGLDSVVVTGRDAFDSLELVRVDRLDVGLGFWSLFSGGPVEVHRIELDKPRIHVIVLPDSTTNTDILKEVASTTSSDTSAGASLSLESYTITDGSLIYDDRLGGTYVEATGINHIGSGDFEAAQFDLNTQTAIAGLTLSSAGVSYLKAATLNYLAVLSVDNQAGLVTLADNTLKLNELNLDFDGTVGLPDPQGNITTDLTFAAPKQDFLALWSVVPAAFAKTLDGVKTNGDFKLAGTIKGTYEAETGSLPGFDVSFGVSDGMVQYPDLPKSLSAINLDGQVSSSGGNLSDLLLDLRRFAFNLGNDPFSGKLKVRNGTTDPAFDLEAKGKLDLAQVQQAFPIEGVTRLAGLVDLDIAASGTASGAQSGDVRRIQSSGTASVQNLVYEAAGTPTVALVSGRASFDGNRMDLTGLQGTAGRSDFKADGALSDVFALLTDQGTLGGQFTLSAGLLDANEWLVEAPVVPGTAQLPAARPFDRFDIGFDASIGRLLYDVYELTEAKAVGRVTPDQLTLNSTSFNTAGSDLALSGQLRNLFGYTYDQEELTGSLTIRSTKLDLLALSNVGLDPQAAAAAAASTTPAEYVPLPERMSITMDARVGQLIYDDITLRNVVGTIAMANQTAALSKGTGEILGGSVLIDGGYTYRGPSIEPTFDLKYGLRNIGFKEAFEQFNTVERLAPVAAYLDGKFNTDMVMSSSLGRDMMPNLENLDAEGFVNTLNAALQGFGPLKKAGELLGIPQLQNLVIGNTKNWFTIEKGLVTVRPFDVNYQGIKATIGGQHGLTQQMNYDIVARIPREMLGKNALGSAANQGIAVLQGQASKLGLNLNVGEFVNVSIKLTGSITDPKVDLKLLGTEGQGTVKDAATAVLKDVAKQARDSVERLAQAKLDEARTKAEGKARAVTDSVKAEASARAQALADEAKARAGAEAKRLADEAKARVGEEAKRAAEEALKAQGQQAGTKAKEALKDILKKKPNG